jgi:predicted PurR-regulated permease PerM
MTSAPIPVAPVAPEPAPVIPPRPHASREEIAAWLIIAAGLVFVMLEHIVSAFVGGLVLYLILDRVAQALSKRFPAAARGIAVTVVTIIGVTVLGGGAALGISFLRHHADRLPAMMTQMAEILQSTRAWLGGYGEQIIPEVLTDAENFKATVVEWLKENALSLKAAGGNVSHGLVHMLMGMLLAILVFFRHQRHPHERRGRLADMLAEKVARLAEAFTRIASAQIKISAMNTVLTAIYLFGILPIFSRRLPFSTTIVLVTFVCGLIPVLGNLVSNTVIVILSMGVSFPTAIASLVFLVLIHKLEYLVNSRIVGGETDSQAWEILLSIVIGETAFGVAGVVMAPIIYTFVKRELRERGLV